MTADQVIARLRRKLAQVPGASLFLQPVQDIRVGGRQSNAQYQFTLQADDLARAARLGAADPRARCAQLPELADVNTDQQDKGLQTSLVIDRDAAARLGVTPRHDRHHAERRLRPAPGLDDLHAAQPVPRGDGGRAASTGNRPEALKTVYVSTPSRRAGAAVRVRHATARPTRRSASTTRASSSRRRSRSTWRPASRCRRRRARSRTRMARHRRADHRPRHASRARARAFQASLDEPAVADPRRAAHASTSCSACSTRATCTRSRSCRRCRRPASARCWRCCCSGPSSRSSR